MTIANGTNQSRVQKICEIVDLLEKSARSNDATTDEIWALMEPALERISAFVGAEPPEASTAVSGGPDQETAKTQETQQDGALSLARAREALAGYGNGFLQRDDLIFLDLCTELPTDRVANGLEIIARRLTEEFFNRSR